MFVSEKAGSGGVREVVPVKGRDNRVASALVMHDSEFVPCLELLGGAARRTRRTW